MKVLAHYRGKSLSLSISDGARVKDALSKLDVPLEIAIVKKNGKVVSEESALREGDRLEIIRVVYGG